MGTSVSIVLTADRNKRAVSAKCNLRQSKMWFEHEEILNIKVGPARLRNILPTARSVGSKAEIVWEATWPQVGALSAQPGVSPTWPPRIGHFDGGARDTRATSLPWQGQGMTWRKLFSETPRKSVPIPSKEGTDGLIPVWENLLWKFCSALEGLISSYCCFRKKDEKGLDVNMIVKYYRIEIFRFDTS